jgi:hypothetical protein
MNARLRAGLLLAPAAGLLALAACAGDATGPRPGAPSRDYTPTAPEDSVISGYGNPGTGGLEYTCFEYEPETGTEYVATPDTTPSRYELQCTSTTPLPPPPPPAMPAGPGMLVAPVPLEPAESDSVVGGYGTPPTGGLDYTCFEYDPATSTEYVVSDDPECRTKELQYESTRNP